MLKYSYDEVKSIVESHEGFILLSEKYIDTKTKLDIKCPHGHIFHPYLLNFKKSGSCGHPECKNLKNSKSNTHSYKHVRDYIENKGYELLSKKYVRALDKLDFKCQDGHLFKMRFSAFHSGQRCPVCANNNKRHDIDFIKKFLFDEGYVLLSTEYKGALLGLRMRCPKGHQFEMRFNSFQQGQRCPLCALSIQKSKPEVEIYKYIKDKYDYNVISGDRSTVLNEKTGRFLEIDILLPDIKKAIEYNAIHWHRGSDAEYKDMIKKEKCKKLGIDLMVIDHNQWILNKNFSIIDDFIQKGIGDRIC
jgi:hypothetical protein